MLGKTTSITSDAMKNWETIDEVENATLSVGVPLDNAKVISSSLLGAAITRVSAQIAALPEFLRPSVGPADLIQAAGLQPEIKGRYIQVGQDRMVEIVPENLDAIVMTCASLSQFAGMARARVRREISMWASEQITAINELYELYQYAQEEYLAKRRQRAAALGVDYDALFEGDALEIVDKTTQPTARPVRSAVRPSYVNHERASIYRGWENPRYPHPDLEETRKYGIALAVQRIGNGQWQLIEDSAPTHVGDSAAEVLTRFIESHVKEENLAGAKASAPKVFKAAESDALYEQGL